MTQRFRAGLIAAVLGLASFAPLSHAIANDAIDTVTTGSVPAEAGITAGEPKGSEAFRAALAVLLAGDPVAAYSQAAALDNAVERRTVQWAAIYFHAGEIDYRSIEQFIADAPGFAPTSIARTRIEQSLTRAEADAGAVIKTLAGSTPRTVDGRILLASAYLAEGDTQRATSLARSIWIDNFLTEAQEAKVAARLGSLLDGEAHWARAVHLMMHDRARGSERLLPHLTEAQKSLVVARAAVSRNAGNAKALLDDVDESLHDHPVYLYSRAQRARQFALWESAVDWLNRAPEVLPDSAEWWYERRTLIRQLLNEGEPALAYQAAAGYRRGPEGRLVEAHFHAGWIALSFLADPAAATQHFTAMAGLATLPDSVTQANYWLARAHRAAGNAASAQAALETAAAFGTVYYGQLARAELGEAGVDIRPLPDARPSETLFNAHPVVGAVRLLAANGQAKMAVPLLRHFGAGLTRGGELLLAAQLAEEIDAHHLAISIANTADQRGTPLDMFSFPQAGLPDDARLAADRAAVYAVVRQESMFQIDAVSSAGARGLMQLMPGTAREVAREVGVDYSPGRLVSDAAYNALLGSTYLSAQLERYDGSLVLAAAAYNAGPGNANKWIRAYGDPRADNVDPVIWVELIPFQETRTYVKRVLGNYLVYRARLGDSPLTLQQALRTIR
ncbi:MAG: lytic transglycosylase domain-containing protein [Alphaproteobacteria bacterium]|nr:lytic transglycosylase domain-containing protein [Alphaproteobacteria bacterium]MBU1559247.1 lytic transglycosylase domain-containing protein [Alphaproteobacteria bacterium]MBU2303187.1 lytic transglycosylase domain-containing protein [Alphaproteobacteria bacterium]MBU2366575.1 lytic transglycosylase domain-containing protein [Alphaproteobacteria bacterium]